MAKRAAEQELEKKGDKKRVMGQPLRGVSLEDYGRMQLAVEAAMRPETDQPIILLVEDRTYGDECDYDLALYPSDRDAALHLLQKLDVTAGERHIKLVDALYDIDNQWRDGMNAKADAEESERVKQESQDRMLAECGIASVGRVERVYDMGEFSPFLYFQRCWRSAKRDDDSESSGY